MVRVSVLFCFLFSTVVAYAQDVSVTSEVDAPATETISDVAQDNKPPMASGITLPKNNAMQFSIIKNGDCDDCTWIAAEGSISSDTPDVFIDFINKNPVPASSVVLLHSNGGDLLAAMTLGKVIKEKGFSTNVGRTVSSGAENNTVFTREAGYCANACIWSYLGGNERNLDSGSVVALRTYRPPLDEAGTISGMEVGSRKQQLVEIAYIDDYAKLMGFNRDIIFIDWQNSDLHHFAPDEMIAYNIVYSPQSFEPWYLIPEKDGLIAQTNTKDNQRAVQFYCEKQSPKKMETFVKIVLPSRIDESELESLAKNPVSLSVFGQKIKLDKRQFSYNENNTILKMPLSNFKPSTLSDDDYNIIIGNAAKGSHPFKAFEISNFKDLASFKALSQLALHSCLDGK